MYYNGVTYNGNSDGTKHCGEGLFKWLDGRFYEGSYKENQKESKVKCYWNDGSVYEGNFKNGLRHGDGKLLWNNGETYFGHFFNDHLDGLGIYTWPDGSSYNGMFQNNLRSGYGELCKPNGDKFQGIFFNDKQSGPGIYTYKESKKQDVGIWSGSKLVKTCFHADDLFTYNNGSTDNGIKITQQPLLSLSLIEELTSLREKLCIPLSFPYEAIINGDDKLNLSKGPLEELSECFLFAAFCGNLSKVKSIFDSGLIHPDVTDCKGHSALIAASTNCHLQVVNYLLDVGANINKLTDEKLSVLSACLILLYSQQHFIENISENMPKDNLFNFVEVEKKNGSVVCRNEFRTIMSIYELLYFHFKKRHPKVKTPISQFSYQNSLTSSTGNEFENSDFFFDSWKVGFYQNSMSKAKQTDEINNQFKNLLIQTDEYFNSPISDINLDIVDTKACNSLPHIKACSSTIASVCGYESGSNMENEPATRHESKIQNEIVSKLIHKERKPHLEKTIKVLLKRGADPNVSTVPMPALFFAVKSADTLAVQTFLAKNADTTSRIEKGLSALHIGVALPSTESIEITNLLLQHGADPDARDNYFGEKQDGRTALHIVCCREDDYIATNKIAEMLLQCGASPDLLSCGSSALSLAIASGNDLIVETLLKRNVNPNLKLKNGLGSALCVATTFQAECHRTPLERMNLIEKLIAHGGDILTPVYISDKHPPGTVVDYAYFIFTQDRRIAFTPYHALSLIEREIYKARKHMLACLGNFLRDAVLKKETELNRDFKKDTSKILFDTDINQPRFVRVSNLRGENDEICGLRYLIVELCIGKARSKGLQAAQDAKVVDWRKRFWYCYECGRSIGVQLIPCKRCKQIFFCSRACKTNGGSLRHRRECLNDWYQTFATKDDWYCTKPSQQKSDHKKLSLKKRQNIIIKKEALCKKTIVLTDTKTFERNASNILPKL